ncbi:uncharacterized protein DFL_000169 [Arthrobotrys flagrans]|uniref:Uncharacterized protein n=1 Tax=Arthrobotrys flagrans TaxID=97331 RepID=A0A437AEK7_ARTFL|nr:hypothetical protein DFL_000169 [Arthrobotrys flagrans]
MYARCVGIVGLSPDLPLFHPAPPSHSQCPLPINISPTDRLFDPGIKTVSSRKFESDNFFSSQVSGSDRAPSLASTQSDNPTKAPALGCRAF